MNQVDIATRGWPIVGDTANSRFFEVRPGVLCAVPRAGAVDDLTTASENRAYQEAYFRRLGLPGIVIVLMDGFVSQDKAARTVYQKADEPLLHAVALVASSLLGRAIVAFSMGMRRQKLLVKPFATLEDALAWTNKELPPNAMKVGG
jgi:hypothetical protein